MLQMTPQELETIRQDCRRLASRKARISAGAAIVPLPLLDVAADVRLLSGLLPEITERFGLSPEKIKEMPTGQREKVHWHMRHRQPGFFGQLMIARWCGATCRNTWDACWPPRWPSSCRWPAPCWPARSAISR